MKYLAHGGTFTRLAPGSKLILYGSGHNGSKRLAGEAVIDRVSFMHPDDVFVAFQDRLFLDSDELHAYVRKFEGRQNKKLLVLELKDSRRYPNAPRVSMPISMAGQYLTDTQYSDVVSRSE